MLQLNVLLPMAVESIRSPREVFRRLLDMNLPRSALWTALALTVVLSVIFAEITTLLAGTPPEGATVIVVSPFAFGAIQGAVLVLAVFAMFWVGRAMGGIGDLSDCILAVTWLQFVMVCLQMAQTVAIIAIPPFAALVIFAGLVLFFWLLTNFIAELHGFDSLGRVFAMILFTMLGVALVLSFILTLSGVTVPR